MGLLVPSPRQARAAHSFSGRPSSTWGTLITGGAANTEGTKTELVASTTDDYDLIVIDVGEMSTATTLTSALLSIYMGASFEHTLIPNLLAGWSPTLNGGAPPLSYAFPLRIPRGVRLGAALRPLIASDTCYVRISLYKTGQWAGGKCEAVGANTTNSRGTSVTPGTTSDGSFANLGATSFNWKWALGRVVGNTDTSMNAGGLSYELGVGSALLPMQGLFYGVDNASEWHTTSRIYGAPVSVASGTTVQIRARHQGTAEVHYGMAWGVG